ncbi:MAG: TauD/TfdA family dioxygenase [Labilithrix sp.]|nr:TauD/TfdA family dioxygenase [Labilithrix sp.]
MAVQGPDLLRTVSSAGHAVVPLARPGEMTPEKLRDVIAASPYTFAERLLGLEPLLVERQPIRPVDEGRSFASTRGPTPLHTDSQMFLGVPAAIQILVCIKPASSGGESLLLDGARLLARLERDEPSLADAIFDVDRVQRFFFGDVSGPTLALRGGHLAWTVSPPDTVGPGSIGARLAEEIARDEREASVVVALRAGEALIASNHRMLHGRKAFEGDRELVRLLVWLDTPLAADPRHVKRAKEVAPPPLPHVRMRIRAVLAILRGVPPAKLARENGASEATLYGWRDAFLRGGLRALEDEDVKYT